MRETVDTYTLSYTSARMKCKMTTQEETKIKAYIEMMYSEYRLSSKCYLGNYSVNHLSWEDIHEFFLDDPFEFFLYRQNNTRRAEDKATFDAAPLLRSDFEKVKKTSGKKPRRIADYLKIYYKYKNAYTEIELAALCNLSLQTYKEKLGAALMDECRQATACPYKALLPEYEIVEGIDIK